MGQPERAVDSTRMVSKFELRRTPVPSPPESGTMESARATAAMPAFESERLLKASVPTPLQEMRVVCIEAALESATPAPSPASTPAPAPPESGAWQAAVLALVLAVTFGLTASLIGLVLF